MLSCRIAWAILDTCDQATLGAPGHYRTGKLTKRGKTVRAAYCALARWDLIEQEWRDEIAEHLRRQKAR